MRGVAWLAYLHTFQATESPQNPGRFMEYHVRQVAAVMSRSLNAPRSGLSHFSQSSTYNSLVRGRRSVRWVNQLLAA
jgi:hypothetical protein